LAHLKPKREGKKQEGFMEKQLVKVAPQTLDLADIDCEAQEALFAIDDRLVLKLDNNEATVGPSPLVFKAISRAAADNQLNIEADIYSRRLRRKISHYVGANYNSIACFSSISDSLAVLARTYLTFGLEALAVYPAEKSIVDILISSGAQVNVTEHEDVFRPNVEEITRKISPKTRLIYLGNPANCSGACFSEAELVFLLSYAEKSLIVLDESYYEFCGITMVDLTKKFSNLVILRTFAKAFALAGAPTSYIITDPQNIRFIIRIGQYSAPNFLAQTAALAALDDISYMVDYVRQVNRAKHMLFDNLTRMGYAFIITAANFMILKVPDSENICRSFARNNIYVRDLSDIPGMNGYIQLTVGTPVQMETVLEHLGRQSKENAEKLNNVPFQAVDTSKIIIRDNIEIIKEPEPDYIERYY
jgi:histidinol-phosphate aminotransferase